MTQTKTKTKTIVTVGLVALSIISMVAGLWFMGGKSASIFGGGAKAPVSGVGTSFSFQAPQTKLPNGASESMEYSAVTESGDSENVEASLPELAFALRPVTVGTRVYYNGAPAYVIAHIENSGGKKSDAFTFRAYVVNYVQGGIGLSSSQEDYAKFAAKLKSGDIGDIEKKNPHILQYKTTINNLDPGQTVTIKKELMRIIPSQPVHTSSFWVFVIDKENSVSESDETNNAKMQPIIIA